jgi:hypothetical protein
VFAIHTVLGHIFAEAVEEVADVVEERACDEFVGGTGLFGQVRGLQGVLGLRDLLAEIQFAAVVVEEIEDLVDDAHATILGQSIHRGFGAADALTTIISGMKILLTGATGNIGKGLVPMLTAAGHELVLSDVNRQDFGDIPFHQLDIQHGFGLEKAAEGCDAIVHLPAWHGIHWNQKTEADYWRLNIDGTFWMFQAARTHGIQRVVFLSSTAWYGHYDKYGFTKRIGEELCEYNRRNHGVRFVAVRPNDLTPWGSDWLNGYGTRLLRGGVDRNDVLDCVVAAVQRLSGSATGEAEGIVVEALRPNAYTPEQAAAWELDPIGTCEAIFPGSRELVEKYGLRIQGKPSITTSNLGWEEVGYAPHRHFGTFLTELRRLDAEIGEEAVRALRCDY